MRHGPGEETMHSSEVQTKIRTMLLLRDMSCANRGADWSADIECVEQSTIEYMPAALTTRAHD